MTYVLRCGHRGACGYAPENTLSSFRKALELGADIVELDAQVCASGEVVVIHDAAVDRTTNGTGFVDEMNLDELKALDAGGGEKIPTLCEVLDLVDKKAIVNIELKGEGIAASVLAVMDDYIRAHGWSFDNFLVSSFDHLQLWEMKTLNSPVKAGVLVTMIPPDLVPFAKELGAWSLNVPKESVTKDFVEAVHKNEMKVLAYTANTPEEIVRLKSLEVDGIFSDYPDRI